MPFTLKQVVGKSRERAIINSQFGESVGKAVGSAADLSWAVIGAKRHGALMTTRTASPSPGGAREATAISLEVRKHCSRVEGRPPVAMSPQELGHLPPEGLQHTCPPVGQEFQVSWSSAPNTGFTSDTGKASNISATFGNSSLKRF